MVDMVVEDMEDMEDMVDMVDMAGNMVVGMAPVRDSN